MEEDCDDYNGHKPDGKVDVEAPSPAHLVRQEPSQKRSRDGGDSPHTTHKTRIDRPFVQRDGICQDRQSAGKDARRAHARNGTADDERDAIRSNAADQTADLEDGNGSEEGPLDAPEGVDFAEEELEGGAGEHVCGAVPADVVEAVELVGDARDGCGDDGVV